MPAVEMHRTGRLYMTIQDTSTFFCLGGGGGGETAATPHLQSGYANTNVSAAMYTF